MLSYSPVSAGAAASGYYKQEGYYKTDDQSDEASGQWFGQEAAEYGLQGRIDDDVFAALLQADYSALGGNAKARRTRPGLDLTFNAPKSFSLSGLVYGDERAVLAHDRAVRNVMGLVERDLAKVREFEDGSRMVKPVTGIVAGIYRHDTNRLLEPHLHSHSVIINAVRNSDGEIRALHNDEIARSPRVLTSFYYAELANEARKLGMSIAVNEKGVPSVRGINRETELAFSTRRKQILEHAKTAGRDLDGESMRWATLASRAAKERNVDRGELSAEWKSLAHSIQRDVSHAPTLGPALRAVDELRLTPAKVVARAIDALSERDSSVKKMDIAKQALSFLPSLTVAGFDNTLKAETEGGRIYSAEIAGSKRYALSSMALSETAVRSYAEASAEPLMGSRDARRDLRYGDLSEGQKSAAEAILTGEQRVVLVQGDAGTGKTFILSRVQEILAKQGIGVDAVSFTNKAVEGLREEGFEARTIDSYLHFAPKVEGERILVVDEASMVDTRKMEALFERASSEYRQIVLVGDKDQLKSPSAGRPFERLQEDLPTAYMNLAKDGQRQRNNLAKSVVIDAKAFAGRQAILSLGRSSIETPDIAATAAAKLMSLKGTDSSVAIVTPTNAVRVAINAEVQIIKQASGELGERLSGLDILTRKNLAEAAKDYAGSFAVGDRIRIGENAPLPSGEYQVDKVVASRNALTITSEDGQSKTIYPGQTNAPKIEDVYRPSGETLHVGDSVRFKTGAKSMGLTNGSLGQIVAQSETEISVRVDDRTIDLNKTDDLARTLIPAYAQTGHSLQGATVDNIIVAMSGRDPMADRDSFYVALSRARELQLLITDDQDMLGKRVEKALEPFVSAEDIETKQEAEEAEREWAAQNSQVIENNPKLQEREPPGDKIEHPLGPEVGRATERAEQLSLDLERSRDHGLDL